VVVCRGGGSNLGGVGAKKGVAESENTDGATQRMTVRFELNPGGSEKGERFLSPLKEWEE